MTNSEMEPKHVPVLLQRCIDLLTPAIESTSSPVLVDATLGLGGHSRAFLENFPNLRVIGIDQDAAAIAIASSRLAEYHDRVTIVHSRNDQFLDALHSANVDHVTSVLFDLGVSSMQLDVAERGFAYSVDAPLDMRMNPQGTLTAAEILNSWSEQEIAKVLWEYSGEKFSKRIAREVGKRRAEAEFVRSSQLVELLYAVIPAPARRTGGHPAKRTFQALRIAVNDELGALRQAVPDALDALVVGGRIVVMSYQSGEDSIVKAEFARRTTSDVPLGLPVTADKIQTPFRLLTRGAETATDAEIAENSRAASVKLRAIERVAA